MHSIPIYAWRPLLKIRDYFQSFSKGCRITRRAKFLEEIWHFIFYEILGRRNQISGVCSLPSKLRNLSKLFNITRMRLLLLYLSVDLWPCPRDFVAASDKVVYLESWLVPADLCDLFLLPNLVVRGPALPLGHIRGFPLTNQTNSFTLWGKIKDDTFHLLSLSLSLSLSFSLSLLPSRLFMNIDTIARIPSG